MVLAAAAAVATTILCCVGVFPRACAHHSFVDTGTDNDGHHRPPHPTPVNPAASTKTGDTFRGYAAARPRSTQIEWKGRVKDMSTPEDELDYSPN